MPDDPALILWVGVFDPVLDPEVGEAHQADQKRDAHHAVSDSAMSARGGASVQEREPDLPVTDGHQEDLVERERRNYRGENDLYLGDVTPGYLFDPVVHRGTVTVGLTSRSSTSPTFGLNGLYRGCPSHDWVSHVATPFPSARRALNPRRVLPYVVAATVSTLALPFLGVFFVSELLGFDRVPPLVLAFVATSLAILTSAIGTALWMRHPASNEVSFGDLMIWSWLRDAQAQRQLARAYERLNDESAVITPRERLMNLKAMSEALDRKDPYTYGHSRRVERLAYRTGLVLELPVRDLQNLREAAALHDVGKIYVPDEVLQKEGPLTDEEYAAIKAHSSMGAEMVAFLDRPELTDAVRFHHERWDGAGYPEGVAADSIPLFARIIGTADAYDAMTSMRSYRASLGHKRAVEILVEEKGRQFDPDVVTAFLSTLRKPSLVALSIPVLSGPVEMLRRFAGWLGRSARVDLAVGAASVGMTVAVSGLLVGNAGPNPRPQDDRVVAAAQVLGERVNAERPAEKGSDAGASSRSSAGSRNDGRKSPDQKPDGRKDRERGQRRSDTASAGQNNGDTLSGVAGSNGSGGSSEGSSSGSGAVTAAGSSDPVDDVKDTAGGVANAPDPAPFDPEASTDPNPARGKDCAGGGPDSKGGAIHCGG